MNKQFKKLSIKFMNVLMLLIIIGGVIPVELVASAIEDGLTTEKTPDKKGETTLDKEEPKVEEATSFTKLRLRSSPGYEDVEKVISFSEDERSDNVAPIDDFRTDTIGSIADLFPSVFHTQIKSQIVSAYPGQIIYYDTPLTREMFESVKYIRSNGVFNFSNFDLRNLDILTGLTKIDFSAGFHLESTDYFFEKIENLTNLEILNLINPAYSHGENKNYTIKIPYLPNLQELSLYWWGAGKTNSTSFTPSVVFDGSSISKANLPSITKLNLSVTPLESYDSIGELDTLKELNVNHSYPTLDNIDFLKDLTNLTKIDLTYNAITDFSPLENSTASWKGNNQRHYYAKEKALTYYNGVGKIELPALIKLGSETVLNSSSFSGYDPVFSVYDNLKNNVVLENLAINQLNEYKFYLPDGYINGINTPYKAKSVKVNYSSELNGNIINGYFLWEINFEDGKPNVAPEFFGVSDKIIKESLFFDPLDGITAIDEEDGDLTKQIEIINNTVDPNISGEYEVTYKVTDSKGASSTATMKVYVDEKPEINGAVDVTINESIVVEDKKILVSENVNIIQTAINVPDLALMKILNSKIDPTRDSLHPILESEMLLITELVIWQDRDPDVSNLTGLEFAKNLTRLQLKAKGLVDISPLSELTSLTNLALIDSSVEDISSMKKNDNLKILHIRPKYVYESSFGVSPRSAVSNKTVSQIPEKFPNLEILNLSGYMNGNQFDSKNHPTYAGSITNIEPLSKLLNLKSIELHQNSITDFSPLVDSIETDGLSYQQVFFKERKYFDAKEDGSKPYLMEIPEMVDIKGNVVKNTVAFGGPKPNGIYKLKASRGMLNGSIVLVFQTLDTFPTPPEIFADDKKIRQGDSFDPLKDVSAFDKQDGIIEIKTENVIRMEVDSNVPGIYEVEYSVSDSMGSKTNKTITVEVDGKPVIHGVNDLSIKVGDLFNPMDGVTVTDKEDDLLGLVVNLEISGSVDTTKAGKYILTYTATDSAGNVTSVDRVVTINEESEIVIPDLINPEITKPEVSSKPKLESTGFDYNIIIFSFLSVILLFSFKTNLKKK